MIPFCKNIFAGAPTFSTGTDMYKWITNTINNSDVVDNNRLVCASTPYKSDRNDATHQAVDLGLYPTKFKPINEGDGEYNRRVNWSRIDLSIECKVDPTDQDPFDETADDLLPTAAHRKKALGQILTYVENVFMHQHRTLHYMILFLGHYARIVRFDHSGVYSTTKFNYKTDGAILTTFLCRYSARDAAQRGNDPTATRLELRDPLVAQMRKLGQEKRKADPEDHVQQMFNASLDNAWPWYKLEVHPPRIARTFVVGKPHFDAGGVVGRGTHGYVAVEVNAGGQLVGPFVYLKDAWRVDHTGIEQEGCVLEELNRHKVPFVPTLVCHGDLKGQVTESQDAWARRQVKNRRLKRTFKKHQHYRLVVAQVGKPLEQFTTGLELVSAIYCCLSAHQAAYEKAGIIHRDISSGNILLHQAPNGTWLALLNDWELSKRVNSPVARPPDRTGTWQFMSVRALNNPDKEIVTEDEIEALFHVLLFHAVRFLPNNIKPVSVPRFLTDYFDGCTVREDSDDYGCGSAKETAMRLGEIYLSAYNNTQTSLKFLHPEDPDKAHPIGRLISRLLISFKAAYATEPDNMEEGDTRTEFNTSNIFAALSAIPNIPPSQNPTAPAPASPPKPTETRSRGKSRALPKTSSRRRGLKTASATRSTLSTSSSSRDSGLVPISLKEHGPVVELFLQCLHRGKWPAEDKGEDLREKVKAKDTSREAPNDTGKGESKSGKRTRANAQPGPSSSKKRRVQV
ncbi:hypothetical protein L226DRAFT_564079 [Lentinus tigrinus ALCF2SS1-7]|uniref:Protein kinase domain-containing protein n=1 Tax=Lentinus tigrinus ALCF2SS1-6 TaxID=1328759 RepID=A0A5C2RMA8_9APHY|nr:hypothetical protein L227DRAFT_604941 [Lentinus tigrinus ALCF2SS1-6]RPD68094.1 hypothetical protein L226DRAFT_564079 [Lentinus tigrinus ALCF2SS1-7]